MVTPGPACWWAAMPLRTNMPAPMVEPIPKIMRSATPRAFFRRYWGCSL
ncbi:MAG: hypothetical protein ACK4WF_05705 [Candidatus Brocadiales bacterium]